MDGIQLDMRDKKIILEQIKALAPYYVPQWNLTDENPDLGWALAEVFASMMEKTITSYNQVPQRNFVSFLNMLGNRLLPGLSAKGHVTITINQGTPGGVYIKRGTQLYVDSESDQGRVLYETRDDIYAIDNRVIDVYCVDTSRDLIVQPKVPQVWPELMTLFDFDNYPNLQQHVLYLAHEDMLTIMSGSQVELELYSKTSRGQEAKMATDLANKKNFSWQVLTETGWQKLHQVSTIGNKIIIKVPPGLQPCLTQIEERLGRWLKCEYISQEQVSSLSLSEMKISARGKEIIPELLLNNDVQLDTTSFLPFGETFSLYDDFYIGCQEVFTKKGAYITINFSLEYIKIPVPNMLDDDGLNWKLVMNDSNFREKKPSEITIQEIIWEYWNGNGWARLFFNQEYEEIFLPQDTTNANERIIFPCPGDMSSSYVGAHHNYWIRARIRKANNLYRLHAYYQSPLIRGLTLEYSYRDNTPRVSRLMVEQDLVVKSLHLGQEKDISIFAQAATKEIAIYLGLEQSLMGGPITMYWQLEPTEEQTRPMLKWEYYGQVDGEFKWLELKVSDETKFLHHSGLVTLSGRKNFVPGILYGEQRFWLRLVDTDGQYSHCSDSAKTKPPRLKGIYFNTVRVVQQDTYTTQYFVIQPQEQHKVCDLPGENLVWQEVWVDEYGSLTTQQQAELKQSDNMNQIDIQQNQEGTITNIWVKWTQVVDLINAGPQDRCYMVDENNGRIHFGNGEQGKIPPARDQETIKIKFSLGRGDDGNIGPDVITAFAHSVPFIDNVTNVEPVLGGCTKEQIDRALDRGPYSLKSHGRIVTTEDYVALVKQADRNIVQVKCLPHHNPAGERELGAITITILPINYNSTYSYFDSIKQNVIKLLDDSCPSVVYSSQQLYVVEAVYVEIWTKVELVIADYNLFQETLNGVEQSLEKFLDPIKGNYQGRGWEIGQLPTREKIYNFIKGIGKIKKINSVNISTYIVTPEGRKEIDHKEVSHFPTVIPICGENEVVILVDN